jgi:hypothetical protein
MDTVIFTGRVALDELEHDKPAEYEALMASADPEARMRPGMSPQRLAWIRVFGFCALVVGLSLVGLIIYAMLFGYR